MKTPKELPCKMLDLSKSNPCDRAFPEVTCKSFTNQSCPKKTGKRKITQACFRMVTVK